MSSVCNTIEGSMQHSQGLRVVFNAWQNFPVRNQHASECMCILQDRLDLRSEQKQEMANLRKHFLHSLSECHEAREVICLGLQQVRERAIRASVLTIVQLEQGIVMGETGTCPPPGHEGQRTPTHALDISQHHRDCLCVSFTFEKALSRAGYTEDPNCIHNN